MEIYLHILHTLDIPTNRIPSRTYVFSNNPYPKYFDNRKIKGVAWSYIFEKDEEWRMRVITRVISTMRLKRTKYFAARVCGTVGTPLNMALATLACTRPNIKRIYICDEPWIKTLQQKSSKEANVPIITRNTKSLIPYKVLRILGKGKVLFVSYRDNLKFSLFQEDDLRKLKAYPKIVTQLAKLRKKNLIMGNTNTKRNGFQMTKL